MCLGCGYGQFLAWYTRMFKCVYVSIFGENQAFVSDVWGLLVVIFGISSCEVVFLL